MRDYFDIDDILIEDQRVANIFVDTTPRVGYLDSSSTNEDLLQGAKVELPLWLSETMKKFEYTRLETPLNYNKRFVQRLKADPSVINLRERCPHYFEMGQKLAYILRHDNYKEMLADIRRAFALRFTDSIMDRALHSRTTDSSSFTNTLTDSEQKLFYAGFHASNEYFNWKSRKISTIKPSSVVVERRLKRKFNEMATNSNE